jgi:hypothetical protein
MEKWDVRASINSDMLIPTVNVRVEILLYLLMTPLMRGIEAGDNVSHTRKSPRRGYLRISAITERGYELMICCKILTLDFI